MEITTTDAVTAIQSDCLPLDPHETGGGRTQALTKSIAETEFKRRGFDTVSFLSREAVGESNQIDRIKSYSTVCAIASTCVPVRYSILLLLVACCS